MDRTGEDAYTPSAARKRLQVSNGALDPKMGMATNQYKNSENPLTSQIITLKKMEAVKLPAQISRVILLESFNLPECFRQIIRRKIRWWKSRLFHLT